MPGFKIYVCSIAFSLDPCPATPCSACLGKIAILPTSVSCSHGKRQLKSFLVESQESFSCLPWSLAVFCQSAVPHRVTECTGISQAADHNGSFKMLCFSFFHKLVICFLDSWSPCLPLALLTLPYFFCFVSVTLPLPVLVHIPKRLCMVEPLLLCTLHENFVYTVAFPAFSHSTSSHLCFSSLAASLLFAHTISASLKAQFMRSRWASLVAMMWCGKEEPLWRGYHCLGNRSLAWTLRMLQALTTPDSPCVKPASCMVKKEAVCISLHS